MTIVTTPGVFVNGILDVRKQWKLLDYEQLTGFDHRTGAAKIAPAIDTVRRSFFNAARAISRRAALDTP
jgi:hypothetical protein